MVCCLNPDCQNPQNPDGTNFCQSCGSKLLPLLRNRYRVTQLLSDEGGFGRTYLAEDIDKLNKPCVVKQLAPQQQGTQALNKAKQLFEQEALQLENLGEHPQIPALHAYFEESGQLYLVQQFIEGQNLLKELEEQGAFKEEQIREILLDLLPVLKFIHSYKVIHRDIKPQNIMRRQSDKRLVLIDFGASKELSATVMARTGTRLGSYGYAPLEQMEGGEAYPASDLFGLGATCFHLMSGIHPWQLWTRQGYGWVASWRQHLKHPVSQKLALVLDKLLQVEREDRYQLADEVLKYLNEQTLIVSQLGQGHYRSISEAIRSAQSGTRILVQPGIYNEGLVIDKPLEIIGDGAAADIIIESTESACILMQTDSATVRGLTLRHRAVQEGQEYYAVDIPQGQLVLKDCDITSESLCVVIHGSTANPILRRCKIRNGWGGVVVWENGQGTVEDCDIFGYAYAGVRIYEGGNPIIRRCRIHDGEMIGVLLGNGQGTVEDCDIFGNASAGVEIRTGGNPVIRRCRVYNGKGSGVRVQYNGQGTVEDCHIFGNASAGVAISQEGNSVIRRCKINRNGYKAVSVYDNGAGTVEDCDLTGNAHGAWEIGFFGFGARVQRSGNKE